MTFFLPFRRQLAGAGAALLLAASLRAADPVPAGWFAWPMVEPAAGTALDVSWLNSARGPQLGRIAVRDGKFVDASGQPLRFWGANLSANECFPRTPEEAQLIARRLAKGGVNIARLHHLDNPWGVGSGGSLWPKRNAAHRELDPTQLDKLHRLIAELRTQGIYSNLNMKVSKTLVPADGFAATVSQLPSFQKRADIYDRKMIELQKDYARRLLTTKNPYTGLAPAEDPAVAVVELNNENSLLGFWTRDLGRGLDKFPEPFRRDLEVQWNAWLAQHYADDNALRSAWKPATAEGAGSLVTSASTWQLKPTSGATAEFSAAPASDELVVKVNATTGIAHHVQVSTYALPIADGAVYTVVFEAKADRPREFGVGVSVDNNAEPQQPWRSLGLHETVELGKDWRHFSLTFPAHSVGRSRGQLTLSAGQSTGTVTLRGLRLLRDAPGAGLVAGQSPAQQNVPIPTSYSARQWADWIAFLADTERAFAEEMRTFLKEELHVQAPIVCSQIDYGGLTGLNRERAMDFADAHAYWQHPEFIGGDWDPVNWVIKNSPQLAEFGERAFGELGTLALVRVAGKPFTVSEYDHPAPSEFVSEMYPTVATFAARQDWDIVYPFCIGGYGRTNPKGRLGDFFDQQDHPAKWGQAAFATVTFRRGLVAPAPQAAELQLGSPLWAEQPHADVLWRELIPDSLDFLNVRYAVNDQPGADGSRARLVCRGERESVAPVRLEMAAQGRVYVVDTPQAAAAVGFVGGATISTDALQVECPRFGRDFASITAVSLDGRPLRDSARAVVTLVARAHNQGMEWNKAHNSVGKNWGKGPMLAERVPARITLRGNTARTVHALKPDGSRGPVVPTEIVDGTLTFRVAPEHATLHYEITAR
ncbi:carbohydrate binding domain-containing protein [Opitutus terrae]|uniref:Uncharacterized protein n=1 Tax=Opitutus terrae (strain DSM 11246 / JCM 15787 / PB90-1) TaxID=452637 RepID=B1ZWJ8_OPITP|nr:carbohydrate binding domain-containing protein [Opitutus terrae]ACB73322.1 hypothetical protein Oter_0030 [Opitutus terrae PB90-1]